MRPPSCQYGSGTATGRRAVQRHAAGIDRGLNTNLSPLSTFHRSGCHESRAGSAASRMKAPPSHLALYLRIVKLLVH